MISELIFMFNWLHTFQPEPIIISFGSWRVYWYGLFVVFGVLAALTASLKLAKKFQLSANRIFDMAFWLIIGGLLGARIYHVFLEFDYYRQNFLNIFKIWQGGLAIHGGIIAGILMLLYFSKKDKINFWLLAGLFAPGIALGQAIGRWGNYFNKELFGRPTDWPWGIPIDLMNRPARYISSEFFHPAFLYESLGNLIIFAVVLLIALKTASGKIKNQKILLLSYLILYSLLRFSLEFIRLDQTAYVFGWRWPQVFSALIIIASLAVLFIFRKKNTATN